ncbi:hypothetical protein PIROE2DRAFT_58927 [Piromyces sp. E2]|nr:hypothetical protein PIROE2DRAFT_58927 [Piromyces sp. E2]|eukprot:OUM67165.1 hypothetical protein PIROE2DRAFT_58927 [Piromyces sp. E2]
MANIEVAIVFTALPSISVEFHAYETYTWIVTVYMLTNTAIQPIADIFSGRSLMIAFLIIFVLSSLICGVAPNIGVLIFGRVFQGIGGGGIMSLSFVIISDITPLKKRWRWSFFINIPLGTICIILFYLFYKTPKEQSSITDKIKRIDFLGTLTLCVCLVCILLGLNWGGYILIEHKFAREPITPLFLFKYRNITFSSITNFFQGFVILVFVNSLPLLYQDGRHISATNSGLRIVLILISYSFTAMGSGYLIGKYGHIARYIKTGGFFGAIGAYFITYINVDTPYLLEFVIFMYYGFSVGVIYQNCILAAQQVSPPEYLSITTTLSSFFNFIGSAVGVGIYGAIIQNIYPYCYKKHFPDAAPITINDIHNVPEGNSIYVEAIRKTYLYCIFPVSVLVFLFSLFIKDYKIYNNKKGNSEDRIENKDNCIENNDEVIKDLESNNDDVVITVSKDNKY